MAGTLGFMFYVRGKNRNLVKVAVYSTIMVGISVLISGPAIFLPDSIFLLFIGNILVGFFIAPIASTEIALLKEKVEEVYEEDSSYF